MLKRTISTIMTFTFVFFIIGTVTEIPVNAYSTGTYVTATSQGSNLRSGAGTRYRIVGAVRYNTRFEVTQISGDWGYTPSVSVTNSSSKKSGWIHLGYCTQISSGSSDPAPSLNSSSNSSSISGTLDLDKANEYADMYAYSRNPDYYFYRNADCANYVSQIMIYSGLSVNVEINVNSMRDYYTENGIEYISRPSASQIEAGDILYTSSSHVMFVQEVSNGCVKATGHTNARNRFPISSNNFYGVLKTSVLRNNNNSTVMRGDINGDGRITITDVVRVRMYVENPTGNVDYNKYDVTEDGIIDESDAEALRLYSIGTITSMKGYTKNSNGANKKVVITAARKSNNNERYVLDVTGGGYDSETLIGIYGYHGGQNQIFELVPYDDTYFYIKCSYTDKYWNINYGSDPEKYKKLQIFDYGEGSSNMLFRFEDAGRGEYYIVDMLGEYLGTDFDGDVCAKGTYDNDVMVATFTIEYVV